MVNATGGVANEQPIRRIPRVGPLGSFLERNGTNVSFTINTFSRLHWL
jgi:hypothetical protein